MTECNDKWLETVNEADVGGAFSFVEECPKQPTGELFESVGQSLLEIDPVLSTHLVEGVYETSFDTLEINTIENGPSSSKKMSLPSVVSILFCIYFVFLL